MTAYTLPTTYQAIIYTNSYSRFDFDKKRRERWEETVDRYAEFFRKRVPNNDSRYLTEYEEAIEYIKSLKIMPSMRALWTAGPALDRDNIAGFNCAALHIKSIKSFAEIMYVLLNGAGVGFSVERQYINQLPVVPETLNYVDETIVVEDSKKGWAEAFLEFLESAYAGKIKKIDYSKIRPAGAVLKTFGGKASGPEPLKDLIEFTKKKFDEARGRKLESIECHDIACFIARIVVSGGVRRSACISLSNLSDNRMANAKTGQFYETDLQRVYANNSAVFNERPDAQNFLTFWRDLVESRSGERGIFNRFASNKLIKRNGRRKPIEGVLCNPCSEISLRDRECCNLSEVVIRKDDTLSELLQKVKNATILGCLQSTLDKYEFISEEWTKNAKDERLLGVSLTGLRDHKVLSRVSDEAKVWLGEMKAMAIKTAEEWSKALGINMPAAITCVKPSGTVSQLVDSSSGLHPRYAKYYIRRVRFSVMSPVFKFLDASGLEWKPEVGETRETCRTAVFEFPIKAPEGSVITDDVDATEQLEYYLMLQTFWTEHKPSITVTVEDKEWVKVGAFVYEHFDEICGVSFLPKSNHVYQLAPYEAIDKETYEKYVAKMPSIDLTELYKFEDHDETVGAREMACAGGSCELA